MNNRQIKQKVTELQCQLNKLVEELRKPTKKYNFRNVPSVSELRRAGVKVRVIEERFTKNEMRTLNIKQPATILGPFPRRNLKGDEIHNKGGITSVELLVNGVEYKGQADCDLVDGFNRKFGVKLALQRAIATMPKEVRRQLLNK